MNTIRLARKVLRLEARALQSLIPRVDKSFERAIDLMYRCTGRVVVTGMGKPGFIAGKIAATLASTGTPSLFLHPTEAVHGDLGMVTKQDVVLGISNSGETEEINRLLVTLKKIGAKIVAMTGNKKSTLARNSDVVLDIGISREACPLGLAPTASTTCALALGDALAIGLQKRRGFKVEDFALFHPGGSLGRKVLKVKDLMRIGRTNPVVQEDRTVREALLLITTARAGCCSVVDRKGRLKGIFTDGDLRRHLEGDGGNVISKPVIEVATKKPIRIQQDRLASEALALLRDRKIDELPVVNGRGRVVGLLDVQDLLKAGFV